MKAFGQHTSKSSAVRFPPARGGECWGVGDVPFVCASCSCAPLCVSIDKVQILTGKAKGKVASDDSSEGSSKEDYGEDDEDEEGEYEIEEDEEDLEEDSDSDGE